MPDVPELREGATSLEWELSFSRKHRKPLLVPAARAVRLLFPFAVARAIAGGHQQFKAHIARTLAARREFVAGLERSFVGQAVLRMHDPIDPRRWDHLARLVELPVGIGIHALDRVAWGT